MQRHHAEESDEELARLLAVWLQERPGELISFDVDLRHGETRQVALLRKLAE